MKEVGLKTHAGPSNGWSWSFIVITWFGYL